MSSITCDVIDRTNGKWTPLLLDRGTVLCTWPCIMQCLCISGAGHGLVGLPDLKLMIWYSSCLFEGPGDITSCVAGLVMGQ